MSKAPERIWAEPGMPGYLDEPNELYTVEYVRADLIGELEAKLTRCEKYRDAYMECDRISTQAVRELEAKLSKSEALLAKAVEALADLADCVDDGCFCSEMQMATAMDNARTTLAELSSVSCANLKGQDDE